ncbi:cupin domain-containing protein [Haloechinothrix alba]|uniref:cupin domain-containing protein n=1 Tax=Haloechinothrix alba TaxID=664784 RepID=UPI001595CC5D|nr:cupin domain-containing protein [Haloechinothrix alba]
MVLEDDDVEPFTASLLPGVEIHRLWEIDEQPSLPVTGVKPPSNGPFYPLPGGLRFGLLTIPSGLDYVPPEGADVTAAMAETERTFPGMPAAFDPDRPGMHTTETVDFIIVVSGKGRMRTDDGVEFTLSAGDCLVQNGTAHAWFNDSAEPFVLGFVLCGATSAS